MEEFATTYIYLRYAEEPIPPAPSPIDPGPIINGVLTGDPISTAAFVLLILGVLLLLYLLAYTIKNT